MSLYERWVLPTLLDLVMGRRQMQKYRRALVPAARGRVLEVGIGSGLNLPLYTSGVKAVVGLDPSRRLLAMAQRRPAKAIAPWSCRRAQQPRYRWTMTASTRW